MSETHCSLPIKYVSGKYLIFTESSDVPVSNQHLIAIIGFAWVLQFAVHLICLYKFETCSTGHQVKLGHLDQQKQSNARI